MRPISSPPLLRASVLLALLGPAPSQAAEGSALQRLDTLGRDWWADQGGVAVDGPIPVPARALTLLDAERADPATWLALSLILGLEPAERWRVSNGQTVVRREPTEEEVRLLKQLGPHVGLRNPRSFEVRTEANTVVWVGLSSPAGSVDVPVAWPTEWRTVEARRGMLGAGWPAPKVDAIGIIDGSFEDTLAMRVAWQSEGIVVQDSVRASLGAHSVRLEGDAELVQRVWVEPGVAVDVTVKLAAEGASAGVSLRWEDDAGNVLSEAVSDPLSGGSWTEASVRDTAPQGATAVAVLLRSDGDGFVNADDLRFSRSDLVRGAAAKVVRTWSGATVRLLADPDRVPRADEAMAQIDQAVRGALALLGQPTATVVDVRLDPERSSAEGCAVTTVGEGAACALAVNLRAHWGEPGNPLFVRALTTSLSGITLPPARGDLRATLAYRDGPVPSPWVSFARWLLDTYGTAAVRAAWQSKDLAAFQAGGRTLAQLESDWRP